MPLTAETEARDGAIRSAPPVALLLVHGIGSQKSGQTLDGFLGGMKLAYGDRVKVDRVAADHAALRGFARDIDIFEVHWADCLRGEVVEGSFDFDEIFEAAWFPLLNHRCGLLSAAVVPRGTVLAWTWALVPLTPFLYFGHWGAKFLASIPTGILHTMRENEARRARSKNGGDPAPVKGARTEPRNLLDEILDEVVGDVFNYVHGARNAFPKDRQQNVDIAQRVAEIHRRFVDAASRARERGCQELQVLAHSLGTVVAFRGLSPAAAGAAGPDAAAHLTRFYTIGSPLEKFRFFWTALVESPHAGPAIVDGATLVARADAPDGVKPLTWDNFYSRLDLVSGPLRPFPGWPAPTNRPARGLGGLLSSHVAYHTNRDFLELVGEGLTGVKPTFRESRAGVFFARLRAGLENLLTPLIVVALALFGFVLTAAMGWGTGWVVSQPFEWFGLEGVAAGIRTYFALSVVVVMLASPLIRRGDARKFHALRWAQARP